MEHIPNEQLYTDLKAHIVQCDTDFRSLTLWMIGLIITVVISVGGSIITWYGNYRALDQHVLTLDDSVGIKANKEVVDSNFAAVNQSLGRIEAKVDSIKR